MALVFGFESELGEDGRDVAFDGSGAESESFSDVPVGPSLSHQSEDVAFPGGEKGCYVASLGLSEE